MFMHNFVKLSAEVHELSCQRRRIARDRNNPAVATADSSKM